MRRCAVLFLAIVLTLLVFLDRHVEWSWDCRRCGAHFEHGRILDLIDPRCPSCAQQRSTGGDQ